MSRDKWELRQVVCRHTPRQLALAPSHTLVLLCGSMRSARAPVALSGSAWSASGADRLRLRASLRSKPLFFFSALQNAFSAHVSLARLACGARTVRGSALGDRMAGEWAGALRTCCSEGGPAAREGRRLRAVALRVCMSLLVLVGLPS